MIRLCGKCDVVPRAASNFCKNARKREKNNIQFYYTLYTVIFESGLKHDKMKICFASSTHGENIIVKMTIYNFCNCKTY